MKEIVSVTLLCLIAACASADSHKLLDKEDCKKVKDGVGYFLAVADSLFKEIDKLKAEGDEVKTNKSFENAIKFSELAENYSTVYYVWCKKKKEV
jgi:hypothetical protein